MASIYLSAIESSLLDHLHQNIFIVYQTIFSAPILYDAKHGELHAHYAELRIKLGSCGGEAATLPPLATV